MDFEIRNSNYKREQEGCHEDGQMLPSTEELSSKMSRRTMFRSAQALRIFECFPHASRLRGRPATVMEEQKINIVCIQLLELLVNVAKRQVLCHRLDPWGVILAAAARNTCAHKHVCAPMLLQLRCDVRAIAIAIKGLDSRDGVGRFEPFTKVVSTHQKHGHAASAAS